MAVQIVPQMEVKFSHLEKLIERKVDTWEMAGQTTINKMISCRNQEKYLEEFEKVDGFVFNYFQATYGNLRKRPTVIFLSEELYEHFWIFNKILRRKDEKNLKIHGLDVYIHCYENEKLVYFGFEQKDFHPELQFRSQP